MKLTSIVIPNSVTEIGEYAFKGCTILKENDIVKNPCMDREQVLKNLDEYKANL